ncbi:MAG: hypothetical protein LBO03_08840, partial [Acidaminococcales bacterium]|nr:hypothetical protein [Acidaminococcales bacterium]
EDIPDFAKPWCVYEETSKVLDLFGERVYIYTPYYLVALNARERLLASQTINIVDGEMIAQEFNDILPVCVVLYTEDVGGLKNKIFAFIRQDDKVIDAYEMELQDTAVAKTKVVREKQAPTEKKSEGNVSRPADEPIDKKDRKKPEKGNIGQGRPDKGGGDKDKENPANTEKQEDAAAAAEPEPVFLEKTIPLLYRVQLFFYFDMRRIKLSGTASLAVNIPKERERRFNFNLSAID